MDSPFHTKVRCTNPFSSKHHGEDYVPTAKKTESNWDLYSPCEGEVYISRKQYGTYEGGYGPYGNYIVIKSYTGDWVLMAHLTDLPLVKVGDKVSKGQKIGTAGATGNVTGRHLHIETSHMRGVVYDGSTWFEQFRAHEFPPSDIIDFTRWEVEETMEWKNGSTREPTYSTVADCKKKVNRIGSLDPYETATCHGVIDGCYLLVYNANGTKKTGFVSYAGGVKK